MWAFALHVMERTMEGLEKRKQGFETEFEFIGNMSVNRNIKNLNARNTFGKGEFKIFSFFKLHPQNKYLREQHEK